MPPEPRFSTVSPGWRSATAGGVAAADAWCLVDGCGGGVADADLFAQLPSGDAVLDSHV